MAEKVKLRNGWQAKKSERCIVLWNVASYIRDQVEDEMGRACSTNRETKNAYRILVGKVEGKNPLGRPRHKLVDNIQLDLREIGWGGMDYINLGQDGDQWRAILYKVMNLLVPYIAGKFLNCLKLAAS
jgi:hypothetical protein